MKKVQYSIYFSSNDVHNVSVKCFKLTQLLFLVLDVSSVIRGKHGYNIS